MLLTAFKNLILVVKPREVGLDPAPCQVHLPELEPSFPPTPFEPWGPVAPTLANKAKQGFTSGAKRGLTTSSQVTK